MDVVSWELGVYMATCAAVVIALLLLLEWLDV